MIEKPPTGDPEQRARETENARRQSGLPPEQGDTVQDEQKRQQTRQTGRDPEEADGRGQSG